MDARVQGTSQLESDEGGAIGAGAEEASIDSKANALISPDVLF